MKRNVMITVEEGVIEKARKERINVSSAAEDGILLKVNHKENELTAEYPLELAELDPENYWLKDGKCYKRSKPLFFVNEMGNIRPVEKEQYLLMLQINGRGRYESKKKKPKDEGTFNHMEQP